MIFFSGFSLQGEEVFFEDFLLSSDMCVAGFSYGAQQAFEFVYQRKERVDRLILLSPAFFQTEKTSFIRTQLHYFEAGKEAYMKQFLRNTVFPSKTDLSAYVKKGSKAELEALLRYEWDVQKIKAVLDRGTIIEVFLGLDDKIIPVKKARDFFTPLVTTYILKDTGHLLR